MKRIKLTGLCLLLSAAAMAGFKVDTIRMTGPVDNRINLLILGDGYRAEDSLKFRTDVATVSNYFLNTFPFSRYKQFFNFFALEVISQEAGTDHPGTATDEAGVNQPVANVNTYLQTTFDVGGTHRCIYSSNVSTVIAAANANFPNYDIANVIVNTSYYGGCGGQVTFTTMNSNSPEIFVHEFGHTFAGLSDEYEYGNTNCSPGAQQFHNVSQVTDTNALVWKNWLTNAPIPTPGGSNCNKIGLYKGAQYCADNWYRPKCDCRMRSLGQSFCQVCSERFIVKIDSMVNAIESFSPLPNNVYVPATQQFSVANVRPEPNTMRTDWYVDGVLVKERDTAFLFSTATFGSGAHSVTALSQDTNLASKEPLAVWSHEWIAGDRVAAVAEEALKAMHFGLQPNPAGNTVMLNAEGLTRGSFEIRFRDLLGRTLLSDQGISTGGALDKRFDLDGLQPGVYFVELSCGNESVTQKFLKR